MLVDGRTIITGSFNFSKIECGKSIDRARQAEADEGVPGEL
jgi:hypothetical protein